VIWLPPLDGAVQDTLAVVLPGVATTLVGAEGTVAGPTVTGLEAADWGPDPTALVAVTLNVYAVFGVSPVRTVDVTGGEPLTCTELWAVDPMKGVMM